jgi:cytochrome bd-type quinol oxidase subunit 2
MLGATAPVASVIVPVIVAKVVWAWLKLAERKTKEAKKKNRLFMKLPSYYEP